MDEAFRAALMDSGYRITKPRIEVYELLKKNTLPLSLGEINTLSETSDRSSVYRTLQLFHELSIVTTVPFGWKQKYELAEPFVEHHHHLYCEVCGKIIEIDSEKIEQLVDKLAIEENFVPSSHHFEIRGKCQQCSSGSGVIS